MTNATFTTIAAEDLEKIGGGMINFGQLGQSLGGLIDSFTGGSGKGAQMGGQIGGFIQNLIGMFQGGGGGGAPAAGGGGAGEGA